MEVLSTLLVSLCSIGIVLSLTALVWSVVRLRRAPNDPGVRFGYGWLGAIALLEGPLCCVGVAIGLADQVRTSWLALLTVILMNVLAQPLWLLMLFTGCRKIVLGLGGRVGYAWRAVPEEQVQSLPADERLSLQRYCICQGLVVLPLAGSMSLACVWPLLLAITD